MSLLSSGIEECYCYNEILCIKFFAAYFIFVLVGGVGGWRGLSFPLMYGILYFIGTFYFKTAGDSCRD